MIEQTVRLCAPLISAYNTDASVDRKGIYPENGLTGGAYLVWTEMLKCLNRWIIWHLPGWWCRYFKEKVMSMYVQSTEVILKVEDPGKIRRQYGVSLPGCIWPSEDAGWNCRNEEHYQRGGLGDVKDQTISFEILDRVKTDSSKDDLSLQRIWVRSTLFLKKKGSERSNVAAQTLDESKKSADGNLPILKNKTTSLIANISLLFIDICNKWLTNCHRMSMILTIKIRALLK